MKKFLFIFGTRPEAIKMAPVYKEFQKHNEQCEVKICVTAQHRQMLDQVLAFFKIKPDFDLSLMQPNQGLHELSARIVIELKSVLQQYKPDYVFVHGDTTTSSMSALAAFYSLIKVAHVEAGLRTYNKWSPFPEEMNRQITARLADVHLAPTAMAKANLMKENIDENKIIVTGNTVIDALLYSSEEVEHINDKDIEMLKSLLHSDKKLILVTGHRRENFGQGFLNICEALKTIALANKNVQLVYPVHLNPNVSDVVYKELSGIDNLQLVEPLPYAAFVWLMKRSYIIITDSGGIQEEAPSLGKPVLVMRDTTERPEAVEAGTVMLVGTAKEKIVAAATRLLTNASFYDTMASRQNPYGDGKASQRIVNYFLHEI